MNHTEKRQGENGGEGGGEASKAGSSKAGSRQPLPERCYIADMAPGESFRDIFVVSQVQPERRGEYTVLSLLLSDASGRRKATLWRSTPDMEATLRQSRFIRAFCSVSDKEKYRGEIALERFEPVETPEDLRPYLSALPENHASHRTRLTALLRSIQEPNLRSLLRLLFHVKDGVLRDFCEAVAAQTKHHAYRGGLLEHSVEVAELCDHTCAVLPCLERDFLVTGALLHDIGKLDEMEHGLGAGEYTSSGTLVGHVVSGAFRIRKAADSIDSFPECLKDALMHLILSHHGTLEFGAAREPARAEAHVLSQCDLMSARVHEWRQAEQSAEEGRIAVRVSGKSVHVGDLGLTDLGLTEVSSPSLEEAVIHGTPDTFAEQAMPQAPTFRFATTSASEVNTSFTTAVALPVRGRVAAGLPGQSSDEEEETRKVVLPPGGADFLLHVTGDSMMGAGILDGDLLLVRSQETAKDDEIVVAHLAEGGEVVKRLRRDAAEGQVWLDSENPAYAPLLLTEGARLQGKVVGLLRDF